MAETSFRRLFLTPEELQPPKEYPEVRVTAPRWGSIYSRRARSFLQCRAHFALARTGDEFFAVDDYGVSLAAKLFEEGPGVLNV